jgi:hypothetical protein
MFLSKYNIPKGDDDNNNNKIFITTIIIIATSGRKEGLLTNLEKCMLNIFMMFPMEGEVKHWFNNSRHHCVMVVA